MVIKKNTVPLQHNNQPTQTQHTMYNLTPLQEVASRIYAAKIASYTAILHNNPNVKSINYSLAMEDSIDKAKALLEACKPEPLEVKPLEWNPLGNKEYSKGGEFFVRYFQEKYQLFDYTKSTSEEWFLIGAWDTLEQAKAFAEHIRTR